MPGENSTTVKQRVMAARERQFKRQNKLNAWLDNPEIRQFCKLESEDAQWLEETLIHLGVIDSCLAAVIESCTNHC